jgi:hypothetical protein
MNKYAVVYLNGKPHYLGLYGSQESKIAYARLIAEIQANPTVFLQKENLTIFYSSKMKTIFAAQNVIPCEFYSALSLEFSDLFVC